MSIYDDAAKEKMLKARLDTFVKRREANLRIKETARGQMLAKLCPDGVCPMCKVESDMLRMIITQDKQSAMCRSCLLRITKHRDWANNVERSNDTGIPPLMVIAPRWLLNSRTLRVLRNKVPLTQTAFATQAGWTTSRQSALERGSRTRKVSDSVCERIVLVLEANGIGPEFLEKDSCNPIEARARLEALLEERGGDIEEADENS